MPFLYGDSSAFPLDENFIETLRDLIQACVVILRAQETLDKARELGADTDDLEGDEQDIHERMLDAVEASMRPYNANPEAYGSTVAAEIVQRARDVLGRAGEATKKRAEGSREELRRSVQSARSEVQVALSEFFVRHDLPKMKWRHLWRTHPTEMRAHATGETGIGIVMEMSVPSDHRLARSLKVSELQKGVSFTVPSEASWLRRDTVKRRSLDGYYLVGIDGGPDRTKIALRKSGKSPSSGFEVTVKVGNESGASVLPVDENGKSTDERLELQGEDVSVVYRLAQRAREVLGELEDRRHRLLHALLDGDDVEHIDRPGLFAERLIRTVAPIVREMRRRSSSSGELILKKDLGDGRREEIYVPRQELVRAINTLSIEHRVLFEPFALAEPTQTIGDTLVEQMRSPLAEGSEAKAHAVADQTRLDKPPPLKVVK